MTPVSLHTTKGSRQPSLRMEASSAARSSVLKGGMSSLNVLSTLGTLFAAILPPSFATLTPLATNQDVYLLAIVIDHPQTDPSIVADMRSLEGSVMRLYGVVVILSRWVRGCARLLCGHEAIPSWSVPRGVGSIAGASYVVGLAYQRLHAASRQTYPNLVNYQNPTIRGGQWPNS